MNLQTLKDLHEPITTTVSNVVVLKVGPRVGKTYKDGKPILFTNEKTGTQFQPYKRYFLVTDDSLRPDEGSTYDHGSMFLDLNYTNEKRPVPEKGDKITITIKVVEYNGNFYYKGQRFDIVKPEA